MYILWEARQALCLCRKAVLVKQGKYMKVLGIESTAHTFGIGWTDGDKIIQFNDTYVPPKGQGFIPRDLGEHHTKVGPRLFNDIMNKISDFDAVAFSQGPGIGQALQVGTVFARYLSLKFNKPVYGINHCMAHLEIGIKESNVKNPLFVYVSGGNTQIIVKVNKGRHYGYRVLGETLDMGLGNVFDVFARKVGLKGAPELEKIAKTHKRYIDLPYTVKGMNLTFAGLLTASEKALKLYPKEDVAYSFMHNAFAMMSEAVERALCLTGKNSIIVVGGVAKNTMFKNMLSQICEDHGISFVSPSDEFNGDNGGMIAYTGWLVAQRTINKPLKFKNIIPRPYWRIDEVAW